MDDWKTLKEEILTNPQVAEEYKRLHRELCTSCMKPIEPGQEWCQTPQCNTDLRDSNNRIPAAMVGK